jgi:hypothetical protein
MEYKYGFFGELPKVGISVFTKGDVNVPGPTPQEIEYNQISLDTMKRQNAMYSQLEPYMLQQAGYKTGPDGSIVKMSDAQYYASLNNMQKSQYDASKLQVDQYTKALKGELPLSKAVEGTLAKQKSDLESYLSRKLGPNWQQSTPGIQAMAEFDKQANALREEQMFGKQTASSAMNIAQQNQYNQLLANQMNQTSVAPTWGSGLIGLSAQAQQPYLQRAQMGLQAQMQNAQNDNAMWSGLGGLLGTGLMATTLGGGFTGMGGALAGLLPGPSFKY